MSELSNCEKKALARFYSDGMVLYSNYKQKRFGFHKAIVPKYFNLEYRTQHITDNIHSQGVNPDAEGIVSFDAAH